MTSVMLAETDTYNNRRGLSLKVEVQNSGRENQRTTGKTGRRIVGLSVVEKSEKENSTIKMQSAVWSSLSFYFKMLYE
jgi:hypothetical protein